MTGTVYVAHFHIATNTDKSCYCDIIECVYSKPVSPWALGHYVLLEYFAREKPFESAENLTLCYRVLARIMCHTSTSIGFLTRKIRLCLMLAKRY